jgi:hypothetical protein
MITECGQIRLEDIQVEGSFFWEQDPQSLRWIPKMQLYVNNTSGAVMTLDQANVTFSNITYADGTVDQGFSLQSPISISVPTGSSQLIVTMSEYGFDKKPVFFEFELRIHVFEAQGSLVLTNQNIVQTPQIKGLLYGIELQYYLLDSGKALIRYFMSFRNPHDYPITVEIAIRYFQEIYPIDNAYGSKLSDSEAGSVQTNLSSNGTLFYVNPYLRKIGAQSSYDVSLEYMVENMTKHQDSKEVAEGIELIQLPYVHDATLKVYIPKDSGFLGLYTLGDIDALPPYQESSYEETAMGNCYTMTWKNSISKEDFYVIKLEKVSYLYLFDYNKLGLDLVWFVPFILGILIEKLILGRVARSIKSRLAIYRRKKSSLKKMHTFVRIGQR